MAVIDFNKVHELIKDRTFSMEERFCNSCFTKIDEDHYYTDGNAIKCSCCGLVLGIIPVK